MMIISIRQCRAARAWLGWTQMDLAEASGLSMTTITTFERDAHDTRPASKIAIRQTFERHGIQIHADLGLGLPGTPADDFVAACRSARAWLGWTQAEFAKQVGLDFKTVAWFERRMTTPHDSSKKKMAEAFKRAGIDFQRDRGLTLVPTKDGESHVLHSRRTSKAGARQSPGVGPVVRDGQ